VAIWSPRKTPPWLSYGGTLRLTFSLSLSLAKEDFSLRNLQEKL
jgi:hypothetical protein